MMFSGSIKTRNVLLKIPTLALVCLGGGIAAGVIGCSTIGIEEEKAPQVAAKSETQPQAQAQHKIPAGSPPAGERSGCPIRPL